MFIGTAGWTLRKDAPAGFLEHGPEGEALSHLERYSRGMNCVEINSTFYREHQPKTWARWAATVPDGFRFAVKAPKAITHGAKLARAGAALQQFVDGLSGLGEKLGPLLFQLPPKLVFEAGVAEEFFETLREVHGGLVALEPRHASWFEAEPAALMRRFRVSRVAADPARVPAAAVPGGWAGLRYWRQHGSPKTYYSRYEPAYVAALAEAMRKAAETAEVWCVFDNTALGEAIWNAAEVRELVEG